MLTVMFTADSAIAALSTEIAVLRTEIAKNNSAISTSGAGSVAATLLLV
jgi:hypothetical protein